MFSCEMRLIHSQENNVRYHSARVYIYLDAKDKGLEIELNR